jgi:hypothetical protein
MRILVLCLIFLASASMAESKVEVVQVKEVTLISTEFTKALRAIEKVLASARADKSLSEADVIYFKATLVRLNEVNDKLIKFLKGRKINDNVPGDRAREVLSLLGSARIFTTKLEREGADRIKGEAQQQAFLRAMIKMRNVFVRSSKSIEAKLI